MTLYYRHLIVSFVFFLDMLASDAQAGDTSLWSDGVSFSHAYAFSAPVVADEWLYFPSFKYSTDLGWSGQLKKFQFTEHGSVLDRDGKAALDCQGNPLSAARSFWDETNTGNAVNEMLHAKHNRIVFTDLDKSPRLVALSDEEQAKLPRGLGDSMHSHPVVLDYGNRHTKQDRRILLATNTGVLHLFSDNANVLDESWAFVPAEFLSRKTEDIKTKPYTLDGELSVFLDDIDQDGVIEAEEGDRLWLFFGLRQGGRSYYAMDLTNPDHPTLKWRINGNDENGDFTLLGETWSVPQLAYVSANNGAKQKQSPVVIVGGGNTISDNTASISTNGSGRAIYIIDADNGQKLFSISPENSSQTNLQAPLNYPIPASVVLLDSDQDGFEDRLYVGDTGGDVWRVDMKGDFANWQISKFAALGASSTGSPLRFFGQPVIARSLLRVQTGKNAAVDVPADWVLLGSGDRDNLLSPGSNRYFALPDRQVEPYTKQDPIPAPLTDKDLHSVFSLKNEHQPADVFMKGWYVDVAQSQIWGNGYVVAGNVWFTSFTPETPKRTPVNSGSIGTTRLYQIDLVTGSFIQEQAVVAQFEDRLLENLGLAYQEKYQQLWLTGVSLPADDGSVCNFSAVPVSQALQPRRIAEYISGN